MPNSKSSSSGFFTSTGRTSDGQVYHYHSEKDDHTMDTSSSDNDTTSTHSTSASVSPIVKNPTSSEESSSSDFSSYYSESEEEEEQKNTDEMANPEAFENISLQEDDSADYTHAWRDLRTKVWKFISSSKNNITLNNEKALEILDELEQNETIPVQEKVNLLIRTIINASSYNVLYDYLKWDTFGIVCWRHCSKTVLDRYFMLISVWKSAVPDSAFWQERVGQLRNELQERRWHHLVEQTCDLIKNPRMVKDEIYDDSESSQERVTLKDGLALRILDELQYHYEEIQLADKILLLKKQVESVSFAGRFKEMKNLTFGMVCAMHCSDEVLTRYLELLAEWYKLNPNAVLELLTQVDASTGKQLRELIEDRAYEKNVVTAYRNLTQKIASDLRYQDEIYLHYWKGREVALLKRFVETFSEAECRTVLENVLKDGTPLNRFSSFATQLFAAFNLKRMMPWLIDCMNKLHDRANATSIDRDLLKHILEILEHPTYLTREEKIDLLIAPFTNGEVEFLTRTFGMLVAQYTPELTERYFKLVHGLVSEVPEDRKEEIDHLFLILEFKSSGVINGLHVGMLVVQANLAGRQSLSGLLAYCELLRLFAERGLRARVVKLLAEEGIPNLTFIDVLIKIPNFEKVLLKFLQYGLISEEQEEQIQPLTEALCEAIEACPEEERKQITEKILQPGTPLNRLFSRAIQELLVQFSAQKPSLISDFSLLKKRICYFIFKQCYEPDKTHIAEESWELVKKEEGKEEELDEKSIDSEAIAILRQLESSQTITMEEKVDLLKLMLKFNQFTLFPLHFTAVSYTFGVVCVRYCSHSVVLQFLNLLIQWREKYPLSVLELMSAGDQFNLVELIRKYHNNKEVLTACDNLVKSAEKDCRYYDQEYVNLFRGRDEAYLLQHLQTFVPKDEQAKAFQAILRLGTPLYGYFSFETKKSVAIRLGKVMPFLAECIRELSESLGRPGQWANSPKSIENILQVLEDPTCLKPKEKIDLLRAPFTSNLEEFTTLTFGMVLVMYALHLTPRFLALVKKLAILAKEHERYVGVMEKDRIELNDVFYILENKTSGEKTGAHIGLLLAGRIVDYAFLISYCQLLDFFAKNGFHARVLELMQAKYANYNVNMASTLAEETYRSLIFYFLRNDLWPHGEAQNHGQDRYNDIKPFEEEIFKVIGNLNLEEKEQCFDEILTPGTPLNGYFSEKYKDKVKAIKNVGANLPHTESSNRRTIRANFTGEGIL